jgi:hypothetical protein
MVLVLLMLGPAVSPRVVPARAQPGEKIEDPCAVPEKTILDPRYRIDTLSTDPLPLKGVFPNEAGMAPSTDVRYDMYQYDPDIDPKPNLLLNDTVWVDSAGIGLLTSDDPPSVTVPELASIVGFLRLWSNCAKADFDALDDLLTDFGFGWVCSPGDPFLALHSPVSVICPGGSISRTVGALPLGLMDARWLSETRVGIVVTDGPSYDQFGNVNGHYAQGSVWVLVMTERGWRIDAIVGNVAVPDLWPAIMIPVDV